MSLTSIAGADLTTRQARPHQYQYALYGVHVTSDEPFTFHDGCEVLDCSDGIKGIDDSIARVDFVCGTDEEFSPFRSLHESDAPRFLCRPMCDGTTYVRWSGMFEFRVASDGSQVMY